MCISYHMVFSARKHCLLSWLCLHRVMNLTALRRAVHVATHLQGSGSLAWERSSSSSMHSWQCHVVVTCSVRRMCVHTGITLTEQSVRSPEFRPRVGPPGVEHGHSTVLQACSVQL